MKKTNYIYIIFSIIAFTFSVESCKDEKNMGEAIAEPTKETAIEIIQEKENLQYIQSVYDNENSEYSQGEYCQSLPQKARMMKVGASEGSDTIRNADEIPVYTSENINEKIYVDGTYKYESINTTPADSNYFNILNIENQPIEELIAKTIVKDGTIYLYNKSNEIIQTEQTGNIN